MDLKIIYSDRKTVAISVKSGEVIIRSPIGVKKERLEKILAENMDWVKKALQKSKEFSEKYPEPTKEQVKLLRAAAKKYFSNKCAYYADIMGLKYNRITITGAKTRFGSCSSGKNICFSYRLMLYHEECREYVVVHELAHLKYMNHSKAFYELIEKYMPDYKRRRALLKSR